MGDPRSADYWWSLERLAERILWFLIRECAQCTAQIHCAEMTVVGIWDFSPMAQTEFREYRNCVPRFLAPCGIRGQSNSRMNPPQFFAEMKRPNVSVLLDAFATSGWLMLQAMAILCAALQAMARGLQL